MEDESEPSHTTGIYSCMMSMEFDSLASVGVSVCAVCVGSDPEISLYPARSTPQTTYHHNAHLFDTYHPFSYLTLFSVTCTVCVLCSLPHGVCPVASCASDSTAAAARVRDSTHQHRDNTR